MKNKTLKEIFVFVGFLMVCSCQPTTAPKNNKILQTDSIKKDYTYPKFNFNPYPEVSEIEILPWRKCVKLHIYKENGVTFNILKDTSWYDNRTHCVLQLITDKFNDSIFSFIKEHWIMKDFNNDGFTDFKEIKSPLRQPWYEVFDIKSKKFKSNLLRGEIEEIKTGIFCDFPTTNKAGAEVISDLLYFKNGEAKILGRIYIEMGFKYSDVYKINADTTTAWNERINQRYHDSYFKNPKKDYDKIYDNFFVDYWKKNVNRFIRKKL